MKRFYLGFDLSVEMLKAYKDIISDESICGPYCEIGFSKKGYWTNSSMIALIHQEDFEVFVEEEEEVYYILDINPNIGEMEQLFSSYKEKTGEKEAEIFFHVYKDINPKVFTNSAVIARFVNGDGKLQKVIFEIFE